MVRWVLSRGWIALLGWGVLTAAQAVSVEGMRLWPAPDHTRLVFDLNAPVQHSLFILNDPERVVIDLDAADFNAVLPQLTAADNVIKEIRFAKRGTTDLRVVLDLNRKVKAKSFSLKPQGEYGNRLVLDLEYETAAVSLSKRIPKDIVVPARGRDIVIAIDAGHGGDDSGAIGRKGTREKDVVLKIAKQLEAVIRKQPGMKAVMIRESDYFVSLHKRVEKAREAEADLFVSIHADAFTNRRARGSSVFVLSEHGASSQVAKFLADSENNSDLVGGVSLDDKDQVTQMIVQELRKHGVDVAGKSAKQYNKDVSGVRTRYET